MNATSFIFGFSVCGVLLYVVYYNMNVTTFSNTTDATTENKAIHTVFNRHNSLKKFIFSYRVFGVNEYIRVCNECSIRNSSILPLMPGKKECY